MSESERNHLLRAVELLQAERQKAARLSMPAHARDLGRACGTILRVLADDQHVTDTLIATLEAAKS